MAKQILRIEAIHSNQAFSAKMKHNYRIGKIPNANADYSHLNEQIIRLPVGETYQTFFEKKMMNLSYYDTHKIRKNAIWGYEIMMSYGTNHLPEDFSIKHWSVQSKKFLEDTFGKDNIASAVLHMDEGTPHIHAVVIPVKDGKLSARAFIKDRQAMRDLHVRYYEYTKECGLEPENRYMLIEHTKIGMFYNNIDMALEKNLPEPEAGERLNDYAQRANEFYKEQSLRSFGKDHQISQLQKENAALESANRTIETNTRNQYEGKVTDILKEIGSVANAKHAIRYRDGLQKAIEWTKQTNPELADSVAEIIVNMQHNYERAVEEQNLESELGTDEK